MGRWIDWGKRILALTLAMSLTAAAEARQGDVTGDGVVTLEDGIITLQVVVGMAPSGAANPWDVNGDDRLGLPEAVFSFQEIARTIPDESGVGLMMAWIPAGTFQMGSPETDPNTCSRELPQHPVTIPNGFYMTTTEVTNAQYIKFLNAVGQRGTLDEPWLRTKAESVSSHIIEHEDTGEFSVEPGYAHHPVIHVTWYGARAMADWLTDQEGHEYRLPTEAEWEYSARATTTTLFAFGDCLNTDEANYKGNNPLPGCPEGENREDTVPAGDLGRNLWGLYDMHGNVMEWVEDDLHCSYDEAGGAPDDGSAWIESPRNDYRVYRGGAWYYNAVMARSAFRFGAHPHYEYHDLGFRLVRAE